VFKEKEKWVDNDTLLKDTPAHNHNLRNKRENIIAAVSFQADRNNPQEEWNTPSIPRWITRQNAVNQTPELTEYRLVIEDIVHDLLTVFDLLLVNETHPDPTTERQIVAAYGPGFQGPHGRVIINQCLNQLCTVDRRLAALNELIYQADIEVNKEIIELYLKVIKTLRGYINIIDPTQILDLLRETMVTPPVAPPNSPVTSPSSEEGSLPSALWPDFGFLNDSASGSSYSSAWSSTSASSSSTSTNTDTSFSGDGIPDHDYEDYEENIDTWLCKDSRNRKQ
jgi:hypothetical protein